MRAGVWSHERLANWIAKNYVDRADNLLCVAAVLETTLVIKTVMHHFAWGAGS
jgi:hypothetical protein